MTPELAPLTEASERNLAALRRSLRRSHTFALFLLLADGPARAAVRARLCAWSGAEGVPDLRIFPEGEIGAKALLELLAGTEGAPLAGAVIVDGDTLVEQKTPVYALNVARDVLGRVFAGPLVMILAPRREVELSRLAPDLFDVRRATYEIESERVTRPPSRPPAPPAAAAAPMAPALLEPAPLRVRAGFTKESQQADRSSRRLLQEPTALRGLEASHEPPPPAALADEWLRRAAALEEQGAWSDVMEAAAEALRIARPIGYLDAVASALRLEARAHRHAGHLVEAERAALEALAIAKEHLDDRARAAALDEIASTMEARGAIDAALRARREEQLPLLERPGDSRARAEAMSKVARLLQAAGDSDQAVSVLRDEVVPAFDRIGDTHEKASAAKQVAELLEARGELQEGLRVRVEAAAESPFPGLDFFDEVRAADFFGREAEIEEALALLDDGRRARRWLQIDGASGAGKSSFARAGIVPAVRAGKLRSGPREWIIVVLRPGSDPIVNLAEALVGAAKNDNEGAPALDTRGRSLDGVIRELRASPGALAAMLCEGLPKAHGVLLLVDQLEEVFTLAHAAEPAVKQFDLQLAAALDHPDCPLLLVTTIRSDFVARMGELPALEGKLSTETIRYYLGPMREAGLRAAIEKPAERAGLTYEPGLVDRIVADARSSAGALPLVAHVLQALYATRDGQTMTLRAYDQLGGLGGAIATSADAILYGLDVEDRGRARKMMLRLVKSGRGGDKVRQTATRDEVIAAAGGGPEAERVLTRLSGGRAVGEGGASGAAARLVIVTGDAGRERVDLVHEALIRR